MAKCQVCGKENPAGVEYCEDCGASLKGLPQARSGDAQTASSTPTDGSAPASGGPVSSPGASASPVPSPAAAAPGATPGAKLVMNRYGVPTGEEIPLLADR